MEEEPKESLLVRIKYYTTLTLGLTACLSCFIFFFLIPFILDPSISTLVADFAPDPVVCRTVHTVKLKGMKDCSWSSCKKGCTVDQYECDQIFVNYMHKKFEDFNDTEYYDDEDDIWVVKGVPFFVNIKGCGYPPTTNCTIFADEFGPIGSTFPCYYSRASPNLVIANYSWESAVNPMIMAIIVPNMITGISLGILSYWWYPGCQSGDANYQVPPDQQSKEGEDEDDQSESGASQGSGCSKKEGTPSETKVNLYSNEKSGSMTVIPTEKSV